MTFERVGNSLSIFSRWVRCLYQLSASSDLAITEQLLDQVRTVLEQTQVRDVSIDRGQILLAEDAQGGMKYPDEEIEWLATSVFNRAVDFYCASDDEACRRWAEKAVTLAGHGTDQTLHELLQTKYRALSRDG